MDLGTANTLVYTRGEGISVLNGASVIALDSRTDEVLAMGRDAWKMISSTPSYIVAVRPLRKGAEIADFEVLGGHPPAAQAGGCQPVQPSSAL